MDKSGLPPTVTASNVTRLKLGMSRAEVESILGAPTRVDGSPYPGQLMLVYGRPAGPQYPVMWVHLGDAGVSEVYVKRFFFGDGEGVFALSAELHSRSPAFARTVHPDD